MNRHREFAYELCNKAKTTLKINGLTPDMPMWIRKMSNPKDARIGPWEAGDYTVVDKEVWKSKQASIYFVVGVDKKIYYVGTAKNGVKDRWRLSPATYPSVTPPNPSLPPKQIFHNRCWPMMQQKFQFQRMNNLPYTPFEIKTIFLDDIQDLLKNSDNSPTETNEESIQKFIESIESYIIAGKDKEELPLWNKAK